MTAKTQFYDLYKDVNEGYLVFFERALKDNKEIHFPNIPAHKWVKAIIDEARNTLELRLTRSFAYERYMTLKDHPDTFILKEMTDKQFWRFSSYAIVDYLEKLREHIKRRYKNQDCEPLMKLIIDTRIDYYNFLGLDPWNTDKQYGDIQITSTTDF